MDVTLGDFLNDGSYGRELIDDHLLPMGGAIWSTPVEDMLNFPLAAFLRFCENHGLLKVSERPVWRTVVGGSREYVGRLTAGLSRNVRLNTGVTRIRRSDRSVKA